MCLLLWELYTLVYITTSSNAPISITHLVFATDVGFAYGGFATSVGTSLWILVISRLRDDDTNI